MPVRKSKWGEGRTRNTRSFSISEETFERLRRCAHWEAATFSEVAERSIARAIDLLEQKRGEAYPPVPGAKRTGGLEEL